MSNRTSLDFAPKQRVRVHFLATGLIWAAYVPFVMYLVARMICPPVGRWLDFYAGRWLNAVERLRSQPND